MKCVIMKMEMLTNALRALSYEPFLEIFYRKMIKQLIWLTSFYIFHKSSIKNFRTKWAFALKAVFYTMLYCGCKNENQEARCD